MHRLLALVLLALAALACSGPATPTVAGASTPTAAEATISIAVTPSPTMPDAPTPTRGASPAATATTAPPSPGIATDSSLDAPSQAAGAIAVTPDGRWVVAVNPDSDSITVVDARTLEVRGEVPVGDDPRTVAVTPDSRYALVASQRSATVSAVDLDTLVETARWAVGPMPYGVVTDGTRAYVTEFALGNVATLDLATGAVVMRTRVGDFPAGIAYHDGTLLVTHLFTGKLTEVGAAAGNTMRTVEAGNDANLSQFVAVGAGSRAYLPQTRSNATNTALVFDTTVFPVVNVVDLSTFNVVNGERITLDTADRPVSMPLAVAFGPRGKIYIANAGSEDVSVIDLATARAAANLRVGASPRGIAAAPDGERVFVNNTLDGTISVISTASDTIIETVAITDIPLAPVILLGKRLFNSALEPRLSTDNWISCAVCHFDGMTDGRTWAGFPDGPRNTPSLLGVGDTLPIHWSGDLDELADVELTIRNIQAGSGLAPGDTLDSLGPPHSGLSADLDALAAFMKTLEPLPSPYPSDTAQVASGAQVFGRLNCQACHAAPAFTDGRLHDVGTGDPALERNSHGRGTTFDTPTLRGLWLTAPYFHDGTASTLSDVLATGPVHGVTANLGAGELDDLIAYLLALPITQ